MDVYHGRRFSEYVFNTDHFIWTARVPNSAFSNILPCSSSWAFKSSVRVMRNWPAMLYNGSILEADLLWCLLRHWRKIVIRSCIRCPLVAFWHFFYFIAVDTILLIKTKKRGKNPKRENCRFIVNHVAFPCFLWWKTIQCVKYQEERVTFILMNNWTISYGQ